MVDAHVSGACVERHAGSSPVLGTSKRMTYMVVRFFIFPYEVRLNFEPLFPSLIEGERKEIMIIFLYLPQISE